MECRAGSQASGHTPTLLNSDDPCCWISAGYAAFLTGGGTGKGAKGNLITSIGLTSGDPIVKLKSLMARESCAE